MEESKEFDENVEVYFLGYNLTEYKNWIFRNWRLILIASLATLILLLATIPKSQGGGASNNIPANIPANVPADMPKSMPKGSGKLGLLKKGMGKGLSATGNAIKSAGSAGAHYATVGGIRFAGIIFTIAITIFVLIVFMPITALFAIVFFSVIMLKPKIEFMKSL
jgi:hypothetical protein